MPWIETEPMNEKIKFISAYLNNEESTFLELCVRFNISGKTGSSHDKKVSVRPASAKTHLF